MDICNNIPRLHIEVDCNSDATMVLLIAPLHFVLALSRWSQHSATYVNTQLCHMANRGAHDQETIYDDKDYYGLNNNDFHRVCEAVIQNQSLSPASPRTWLMCRATDIRKIRRVWLRRERLTQSHIAVYINHEGYCTHPAEVDMGRQGAADPNESGPVSLFWALTVSSQYQSTDSRQIPTVYLLQYAMKGDDRLDAKLLTTVVAKVLGSTTPISTWTQP